MGGRNYVLGRAYEYKTMKILRNMGYALVVRSASSHGPVDIVAVGPATVEPRVMLVQVKSRSARLAKGERGELSELARALAPVCQVAVWYFRPRKGRRISNSNPKIRLISRDSPLKECVIEP